jgi:hypothetical protein
MIHEHIDNLPIAPIIDQVKGHQDDKISYKELSLPAQLNVDADALATDELYNFPTRLHASTSLSSLQRTSNPMLPAGPSLANWAPQFAVSMDSAS